MNSRKKKLLSMLAAFAIAFTIWQPTAAVTVHSAGSEVDAQAILEGEPKNLSPPLSTPKKKATATSSWADWMMS